MMTATARTGVGSAAGSGVGGPGALAQSRLTAAQGAPSRMSQASVREASRKVTRPPSALNRRNTLTSLRVILTQFALMVIGFALTTSAFGIWMVAGISGGAGLSLIKLGVSLFMLIMGMCMIVLAKSKSEIG